MKLRDDLLVPTPEQKLRPLDAIRPLLDELTEGDWPRLRKMLRSRFPHAAVQFDCSASHYARYTDLEGR